MTEIKRVTNEEILEALASFVQLVNDRFDRLETRMNALEIRMDRLEQRMDKLEVKMSKIERRLDIVEHDITDLKQTSYRQEQSLGRAIAVFELAHQQTTSAAKP